MERKSLLRGLCNWYDDYVHDPDHPSVIAPPPLVPPSKRQSLLNSPSILANAPFERLPQDLRRGANPAQEFSICADPGSHGFVLRMSKQA
jgi:hypothetical protein